MTKKVTMSDIAAAASVSQPTVSLVLNGSTSIKIADATRKKVLEVAKSLGYQHKKAIHSFDQPKKIALVINNLSSYDHFLDAINSAREEAWLNDYILVTFNYNHDLAFAKQIEKDINSGGYEGLIYASSMTRELEQQRVNTVLPTVLLNCTNQESLKTPSILPADMIGAYKAISHLTQQGYRHIAMLSGESWMLASKQRAEGYRQALIDVDILPNDDYLIHANWSLKEAYQQTLTLFKMAQPPEAIFCASDYMAMGCYQALNQLKLNIPKDVAVVGYDNQQIASEVFPSLSSVELPYSNMGKLAVESLVDLIKQQPLASLKRKVEGELMVRASSIKA